MILSLSNKSVQNYSTVARWMARAFGLWLYCVFILFRALAYAGRKAWVNGYNFRNAFEYGYEFGTNVHACPLTCGLCCDVQFEEEEKMQFDWNNPVSIIESVQKYGWRGNTMYWLELGTIAPLVARGSVWGVTETYQVWNEASLEYFGFLGSEAPLPQQGCEHPAHAKEMQRQALYRMSHTELLKVVKALGLSYTSRKHSALYNLIWNSDSDYGTLRDAMTRA